MPGSFVHLLEPPNVGRKVRKGQTTPAQTDQGSIGVYLLIHLKTKNVMHAIEGYNRPNDVKQQVYLSKK